MGRGKGEFFFSLMAACSTTMRSVETIESAVSGFSSEAQAYPTQCSVREEQESRFRSCMAPHGECPFLKSMISLGQFP